MHIVLYILSWKVFDFRISRLHTLKKKEKT